MKRFEKVIELYSEVNLENTLKLLIRCKLAYDEKRKLLTIFDQINQFQDSVDDYSKLKNELKSDTQNEEAEE